MANRQIALFALLTLMPMNVSADDGAAPIANGGVVMKRENRITMAKEFLAISADRVAVDYDFRNDADQKITTEVAFPIPPYQFDPNGTPAQQAGFDDFRLWIDGKPARYNVQVHARLGRRDVTLPLKAEGIDIASFGHSSWSKDGVDLPQISGLSGRAKARFIKLGLIDKDGISPLWTVEKRYYWSQTFPAHGTIHIRHEYTPVLGNTNSVGYGLVSAKEDPDSAKEIASLCLDPELRRTMVSLVKDRRNTVPFSYVDFILTTANTWKTPIEDFTLVVNRSHPKDVQQEFVSFCWDGPVDKIDSDHFTAHVTNLIPKKELRIGFIDVYRNRN